LIPAGLIGIWNGEQRLARNARPSNAPRLLVTLHGLPATFASSFGFELHATTSSHQSLQALFPASMPFGLAVFLAWLPALSPTFLLMQGNTSVSLDGHVER
jgi:hypothetical protein